MTVEVSEFDTTPDGRCVKAITISNANGTTVTVLDYGATLQSFVYDGVDIVLGFDTMAAYIRNRDTCMGATVGRVCNRTDCRPFEIDAETILLPCNEPVRNCHLHGGFYGFDQQIWVYTQLDNGVRFSYLSVDGEEGYPGNLAVSVSYLLTEDNSLRIEYRATTDKTTVINLTNHAFFNPNGCFGETIKNNLLQIDADEITQVDDCLISTGEYQSLDGSLLDYRQAKCMREAIEQLGGIDNNFVLTKEPDGALRRAAQVKSPDTGIRLTCCTTEPGIQMYSANFLQADDGKSGKKWGIHQAICLETQHFPDSAHHTHFPHILLHPGEEFFSQTEYHVDKEPIVE